MKADHHVSRVPSTRNAGSADYGAAPMRPHLMGGAVRRAKPKLVEACRAIDADEQFASDPLFYEETRILLKLDAYRSWIIDNALRPPSIHGGIATGEVLRHIGHAGAARTDAIREALRGLRDLLAPAEAVFRTMDDDPVELLVRQFADTMKRRKYGLPRTGANGRYNWLGAAKEIGCDPGHLKESQKGYLRSIDRSIGVQGAILESPVTQWDQTPRNAAVTDLLAAELERLQGRMPADPLQPTAIDVVTIADGAGVTVRDITGGPLMDVHREAMNAACAGAPLVAHPLIAARRFRYSELKEAGRKAREDEARLAGIADPAAAARITVRALTQFLSLAKFGGSASDIVPLDLKKRIEHAIASRPKAFGSGWASQITRWIRYCDGLRSSKPLPETFSTAIKILANETGVSRYEIVKVVGNRALGWMQGVSFPTIESEEHVRKLETLLRVEPMTLSRLMASDWRGRRLDIGIKKHGLSGVTHSLPTTMANMSEDEQLAVARDKWEQHVRQKTPYAQRLSQQLRDRYRVAFEDWPAPMREAWFRQTPDLLDARPEREVALPLPGTRPGAAERLAAKGEEERSWRPLTGKMAQNQLGFFFGFLVRPRASDTLKDGASVVADHRRKDTAFKPEAGLGMPSELIHPALFAVVDLLTGYTHWRKRRSGGRVAPTIVATLQHAADFLKPGTGVVWRNRSYLRQLEAFRDWWDSTDGALAEGSVVLDIDAFREDWQAAVEEAYNYLVAYIAAMKSTNPKRKKLRQPFVPLRGYLDADDPMALYMVGVRQMLASKPLLMIDRHRHVRNCVLTLILVQTGLRAATLLLTISGDAPTIRREVDSEGKVRWRIVIPAERFKNFNSKFFSDGQPYDFRLDDEDGLYDLLDDYISRGRRYLLNGKTSDALFVTSGGKPYTEVKLSNTYRRLTGRFFVRNEEAGTGIAGVMPHGLHAVRHVIATSLLRTTGDIYVAAWAIQDTARTVELHYVDFLPRNKSMLAVQHLRKSRLSGCTAS